MANSVLLERLRKVQVELKAPKNQRNDFGKYNYRNCEDILEAVKPLLEKHGLNLTLGDDLVQVGERYYVKATAAVRCNVGSGPEVDELTVHGWAREEETKKGMDGSQITGAASSYARKYALNGLFLIDDTRDSDATNDHGKAPQKPAGGPQAPVDPPKPEPTITADQIANLMRLAKVKGYDTKEKSVGFLNKLAEKPFTQLPQSEFEVFKKQVINSGWGGDEPPVIE